MEVMQGAFQSMVYISGTENTDNFFVSLLGTGTADINLDAIYSINRI